MSIENLYSLRDYVPSDKAFVKSTFLRGLYYGESWFSFLPKQVFMPNFSVVLDNMLVNPNIIVKVACLSDELDVILGYSIYSKDKSTLIWVFVKKDWRKQGIANALIPSSIKCVTNLTALGKTILKASYPDLKFNPFA